MRNIPKVILLVDSSRIVGRSLLCGIAEYTHTHGPWAFYSEPDAKGSVLPQLKGWGANGIIAHIATKKESQKIVAAGIPAITEGYKVPSYPYVEGDYPAMGRMAAEYFLNRGFKHFAYCGWGNGMWSTQRGSSFSKVVTEAGYSSFTYSQSRNREQRKWENEQAFMARWLESLPKPVAVMTANDERGRHVIEACKLADLHVPEQVAILGVDNDDLICGLCEPRLSSIALNTEQAGYEAAWLLDRLMNGDQMCDQRIIVRPTHIVTRHSSDILAIENEGVAKAVRFIRERARETIQVCDVSEAAGVSRRSLERRFRKILNRSILDEIRRVRVEQIALMLVKTNKSVLQIALSLGYNGVDNISRYFKREKGMSPWEFRKQYGHK